MTLAVWGIGDAGERIIARMAREAIPRLRLVAVNTHPSQSDSPPYGVLHIGESSQGAGGMPELGRKAVRYSAEAIYATLTSVDRLWLVGGFGGGTGTGALPALAEMATSLGVTAAAVVSTPFAFEGDHRAALARDGVATLQRIMPQAVVLQGDSVTQWLQESTLPTMQDVFATLDRFMAWNVLARLV